MKILAMYLPQYHEIKENNEWWGKGYTEWTAVKKAKPIYKGHRQPRVPLKNNYYDLSDENATTWKWQAKLAKKYGIYGFCIYHYWFKTGVQLLEKPMEILLNHPEIDIRYCICWANESWARNWYGLHEQILQLQEYGGENEWVNHFQYLLQFFKDTRYIKIDNKPVVNIYRTRNIVELEGMIRCWNRLAKENGFDGIYVVSANTSDKIDKRSELFDAYYNFEPECTFHHYMKKTNQARYFFRKKIVLFSNTICRKKKLWGKFPAKWIYEKNIGNNTINNKKVYFGTFVGWDNTPRRSYKGRVIISSPEEFKNNLKRILIQYRNDNRTDDFIYINAWNEWGEGAYLEPDEWHEYAWLEAVQQAFAEASHDGGGERESFAVTPRRSSSAICASFSPYRASRGRSMLSSPLGTSGARGHIWSRTNGTAMHGSRPCGRPWRRRTPTKSPLRGQML